MMENPIRSIEDIQKKTVSRVCTRKEYEWFISFTDGTDIVIYMEVNNEGCSVLRVCPYDFKKHMYSAIQAGFATQEQMKKENDKFYREMEERREEGERRRYLNLKTKFEREK